MLGLYQLPSELPGALLPFQIQPLPGDIAGSSKLKTRVGRPRKKRAKERAEHGVRAPVDSTIDLVRNQSHEYDPACDNCSDIFAQTRRRMNDLWKSLQSKQSPRGSIPFTGSSPA